MNTILNYIKGFLALFLVLKLLIHMVPRENFQKYIRFFAEIVLALGLLGPMLRFFGDEEAFLDMVEYNEFMEGLEEAAMNAERIEFAQNDAYLREYEKAIEMDVTTQSNQQGFQVQEVSVTLSERYEIESIRLVITDQGEEEDIVIGKIILGDETEEQQENTDEAAYQELKEKLLSYYRLTESQLAIFYET